jgi:hypothetical protein
MFALILFPAAALTLPSAGPSIRPLEPTPHAAILTLQRGVATFDLRDVPGFESTSVSRFQSFAGREQHVGEDVAADTLRRPSPGGHARVRRSQADELCPWPREAGCVRW